MYQVPEDFVRKSVDNNHDGKPDDELISERIISLKVEYGSSAPIEKQIKLVRPPLILIHGIWSGKEMWDKPETTDDFRGKLETKISGIRIFMPNYSNAKHFAENKDVPYSCDGGIEEAKKIATEVK